MRPRAPSNRSAPGVTNVEPGDFVILNWRAVCGQCRACKRGRPHLCFDTFNAEQKMTLTDGTELTPALGIGAFADKTLVHEGQCTKVDPAADPAVAGPAGLRRDGRHRRGDQHRRVNRDDTVAVIGCGGVGDAAIAGAALVGAQADHRRRHRQQEAGLGARVRRHPHHQRQASSIRWRPSRTSPTDSAPTS